MPYITSTLTSPQEYTGWTEAVPGQLTATKKIRIEGGANTASKHFVTENGIVTQVSDADAEWLSNNAAFKRHQERGFVKIHKRSKAETKDLEEADNSAPITKDTAKSKGMATPTTAEG